MVIAFQTEYLKLGMFENTEKVLSLSLFLIYCLFYLRCRYKSSPVWCVRACARCEKSDKQRFDLDGATAADSKQKKFRLCAVYIKYKVSYDIESSLAAAMR